MDLDLHYENLWSEAVSQFHQNNFEIDPLIDSTADQRRGITLLIRPTKQVKKNILKFTTALKKVAPNQYYYPLSDIHITIMSIISCYEGFDLSHFNISAYIQLIHLSIENTNQNQIHFKGITASNSCIMLRGFPQNDTLNVIRNNLRVNFGNTELENSMDKRYKIMTAHSTVVRFKENVTKTNELLHILEKYRDFDFGSFDVSSYELVYNDWYQKKEFTKLLQRFKVPN
tara:strand:- start:23709 stop:24395 length:687 start_codon:yes stop_codon:yes gene_type:complete